jgi:hypothetical protein
MTKPKIGDAFYFACCETNADDTISLSESIIGEAEEQREAAVSCAREDAEGNGATSYIYYCVAVAVVEPLPRSKVTEIEWIAPGPAKQDAPE